MKSKSVFFAFMVVLAMTLPSLAQKTSSAKSVSRHLAIPRCRSSSSAPWLCCTLFGTALAKSCFATYWLRTPRAQSPPGASPLFSCLTLSLAPGLRPKVRPRHKQRSNRAVKSVLRPSANGTTSKRSPLITRIGQIVTNQTGSDHGPRHTRHLPPVTQMMTKRKSFMRFICRARSHRLTRLMRHI